MDILKATNNSIVEKQPGSLLIRVKYFKKLKRNKKNIDSHQYRVNSVWKAPI